MPLIPTHLADSWFFKLLGRFGGQDGAGGTESGDELKLRGTIHPDNNGKVSINPDGGDVDVLGDTTSTMNVVGTTRTKRLLVGGVR